MTDPDVMRTTEQFVFFWKPPAPYSQWTPSVILIDGLTYSCAEQLMMADKARLFGDQSVCDQIMATPDPRKHKRLGRQVRGFVESTWLANRSAIVYRASMAKFSQDPVLRQTLLDTGDRTLVEASPLDQIWGIGLRSTDAGAEDPSQWQGLNLLGLALMQVREALRS